MFRALVVSAVLIVSVFGDYDKAQLDKWHTECFAENGLTEADIPKLKTEVFYEENAGARCLFKCMAIKMGYMDESGKANEEKVNADIKKYNLDEAKVHSCDEEIKNEADLCMKTYKVHKCIFGDKFLDDDE